MPWTVELDQEDRVVARFEGYLDEAGGIASAAEVAELLTTPREVVLDVPRMTGYKRAARLAWQEGLWPHRHAILRFVVIGGNAVVRMGMGMTATFLGRPLALEESVETTMPELDAPQRVRRRASSRALRAALRTGPTPIARASLTAPE